LHPQGEWPSYQYLDHELDRAGEDAAALEGDPAPAGASIGAVPPARVAAELVAGRRLRRP
jgi:hypothetical protein